MIPGVDLLEFIKWASIFGVALVVFAESGLLIGFFLPGDSLLFATGFLIHAGLLPANIHLAVLLVFIAAVLGDSVGYTFGRKLGPRIFKRKDARLFKQEYVKRAQEFYEKHGGKTIIIARFIPIVRTFAPVVAGAGKMDYKRFVLFNIIGGLLWAVGITYAGYFLGSLFEHAGIEIDHVLLPIIALIILISVLPPAIHILKDKKTRQTLWDGTKREIKSIFAKKK
ncbi:VTT domain-containing protein [Candidatus Saccharibacteria bacterium TM7i]|nr:VTT domain-containing protein [Candidatus Saccharibacteria bacterium TM7i]